MKDEVLLNVGGAQAEDRAGEVVVHRVDEDCDPIGVGVVITCREPPGYELGMAVEQPHSDIQGFIVIEESNFGALGGRLAFLGIALRELGGGRRRSPGVVRQMTVDLRRTRRADGEHVPRLGCRSRGLHCVRPLGSGEAEHQRGCADDTPPVSEGFWHVSSCVCSAPVRCSSSVYCVPRAGPAHKKVVVFLSRTFFCPIIALARVVSCDGSIAARHSSFGQS